MARATPALLFDSLASELGRLARRGRNLTKPYPRLSGSSVPILRIQHAVPNFENWKRAFESDPMDRKGSGVRRFEIYRPVNDPNFVMIDLHLDTLADAQTLLEKLRHLWEGPGGAVVRNPEAWILETVES